ncbi:hypothetical protein F2Q70_00034427 [Brassica cretica]|uniref:Glutaredoxin domain-containing protein n=1 Tax=Brassica cretica TaxID=69181 RepID=A0A8S9K010_BRACR|nr:hypothetical protein F2Q70_00034427 [Brassica cretica]
MNPNRMIRDGLLTRAFSFCLSYAGAGPALVSPPSPAADVSELISTGKFEFPSVTLEMMRLIECLRVRRVGQHDAREKEEGAWATPIYSGADRCRKKPQPVVVSWKAVCITQVNFIYKDTSIFHQRINYVWFGPQGTQLQKVLETLTGQRTVPNVFVGGKHIGGCTDTVNLNRKGELELMLAEANAKTDQT